MVLSLDALCDMPWILGEFQVFAEYIKLKPEGATFCFSYPNFWKVFARARLKKISFIASNEMYTLKYISKAL